MTSQLVDRMKERAAVAIEEQEGGLAKVTHWRMVDVRCHQFIASIRVECGGHGFDVWVIVDLDDDSVTCL